MTKQTFLNIYKMMDLHTSKCKKKTKLKNQICLKFFKNTQISQTVRIKFKIHHLAFNLWEYKGQICSFGTKSTSHIVL